jgi:hypothetical protein
MSGFVSGSARSSFHQMFFVHLGSPKVSVLDGWNEGSGSGTLTLVKEVPSFRLGRWSGSRYGPSQP